MCLVAFLLGETDTNDHIVYAAPSTKRTLCLLAIRHQQCLPLEKSVSQDSDQHLSNNRDHRQLFPPIDSFAILYIRTDFASFHYWGTRVVLQTLQSMAVLLFFITNCSSHYKTHLLRVDTYWMRCSVSVYLECINGRGRFKKYKLYGYGV